MNGDFVVIPNVRRGLVTFCLALCVSGCILGNRPTLVKVGTRADQITYYLEGAGNYGFGKETVPLGLADGGYEGHVQHYIWTTYFGAVVDQISVNHNRREGRYLAAKIEGFLNQHSGGEVNLVGLSAGTGVIVFALEAMDPKYSVQNVVLLSSSLSADYDLRMALGRVRGGIYFFWSPNDPILADVVPIVGTVDRSSRDVPPAGMWGARLPFGASEATRDLYSRKVRNVRWYQKKSFLGPFKLRHAGSINRSVVRERVAPILVNPELKSSESKPWSGTGEHFSPPPKEPSRAPTRPESTSPPTESWKPALITRGAPATAPATQPVRLIP